jgi:hypothetical protein
VDRSVRNRAPRARQAARRAGVAAVTLVAVMPAACGGTQPAASSSVAAKPAGAEGARPDSLTSIHRVTYRSSSGSRVSALLASPKAVSTRGCLVLADGYGSPAKGSGRLGQTAAELGLATFSLASGQEDRQAPISPARTLREPAQIAARVNKALSELRGGLRYLDAQGYCRQNVAAVGVGLYGVVVTLLAATDPHVRAAVVVGAPASWRSLLAAAPLPHGTGRAASQTSAARASAVAAQILSPLDPDRWIGRISPRPVMVVSARNDPSVPLASGLALQRAAGNPNTAVTDDGGQDATRGASAEANDQAIGSFLLRNVVEPTYEVSANPNGTYLQP